MADRANIRAYGDLLELVPLSADAALQPVVPGRQPPTPRKERFQGYLFVVCVLLPMLLAGGYLGFIAADRYEVETRFVLRNSSLPLPASPISVFEGTTAIARGSEDGHAVREYLLSRDAVRDVSSKLDLRLLFGRPEGDFAWRFPSVFLPTGFEGLYREYKRFVSIDFDQSTGVITLETQGFRATDAEQLARVLVDSAEKFVNGLNERAQQDAIAVARTEVRSMEARTVQAQQALTSFRQREALVDPDKASLEVVRAISRLSLDAAETKLQFAELRRTSPQSPQLPSLQARIDAIESEIDKNRRLLAGDSASLATKIAEYERLVLEREFSQRALVSALSGLEVARVEAQRQQVYIERVAQPHAPDYAMYPRRSLWLASIFVVSIMLFRIVRVVLIDTLRHANR